MKFNKKMLFGTIGSLLAGIFGIIAFFALSFTAKTDGGVSHADASLTLSQIGDLISDESESWVKAIYGCGVAGLVFTFIGIVFPLVSMFYSNEKLDKSFEILSLVFAALGLVLMLASVAVWAGEESDAIDAGYTAGQFIFVIVGGALAAAGNAVSYKEAWAK